jgi:hypothetical protein
LQKSIEGPIALASITPIGDTISCFDIGKEVLPANLIAVHRSRCGVGEGWWLIMIKPEFVASFPFLLQIELTMM